MSSLLDMFKDEMNKTILDSMGIFAVVDRSGKYCFVSKGWAYKSNKGDTNVIGMDVREFYPNTGCMEAMEKKEPILARPIVGKSENQVQYTSYFPILENDIVLGCCIITFFRGFDEATQFSQAFELVKAEKDLYKHELLALRKTKYSLDNIVGASTAIISVKKQIRYAAKSNSNVLIEGETGTGKELVSQSIHELSARSHKPLVKLNCAAIPEGLSESELFGYEGGAFTGANTSGKIGKFELANGGSLFLDEINQLSYTIQPKLLRVLQEKELERVGGNKQIPFDVRLITATNTSLSDMIRHNKFREDLYYRINVINIRVPALRERLEDIPLLAQDIIDKLNVQMGTSVTGVSDEVIQHFQDYTWPGNIREMQNIIEWAMNERISGLLTWADVASKMEFRTNISELNRQHQILPARSVNSVKADSEKRYIESVLKLYSGNKKKAAEHMNISRTALYNKLKKYGMM